MLKKREASAAGLCRILSKPNTFYEGILLSSSDTHIKELLQQMNTPETGMYTIQLEHAGVSVTSFQIASHKHTPD